MGPSRAVDHLIPREKGNRLGIAELHPRDDRRGKVPGSCHYCRPSDSVECVRHVNLQNGPVTIYGQVIHGSPQPMGYDGAGHRDPNPKLNRLEALHLLHDVGVPEEALAHHTPKNFPHCHRTHPAVLLLQWNQPGSAQHGPQGRGQAAVHTGLHECGQSWQKVPSPTGPAEQILERTWA